MKNLFTLLFLFTFLTAFSQRELSQQQIEAQLKNAENYKNLWYEQFVDPERTPINPDSIQFHHGLKYFEPMDPKYVVMAKFEKIENGRVFEMKMTRDLHPLYKDFAILTFKIDGKEYRLHAYQNIELSKKEEYREYLFIPFNDLTNGNETYGGGRYIDLYQPIGNEIILNFHMAYNPYCAYSDKYTCPIPPDENKLNVRIEAGIKKYH